MRDPVFGQEIIELWAGVLTSIVCMQDFNLLTHFILSNCLEFHELVKYLVFGMEEVNEFSSVVVIDEHSEVSHTVPPIDVGRGPMISEWMRSSSPGAEALGPDGSRSLCAFP